MQVELLVQSPPLFAALVQMLQECTMDESTLFETLKARVASSGIQIPPSQFSEILEKTLEILEMFMGVLSQALSFRELIIINTAYRNALLRKII